MKARSWLIALCGLWEFGDVAAFFTPGFGKVQAFVVSHIITGFVLMVVGTWAARVENARAAKPLYWIAAAAGVWLIAGPAFLGPPEAPAGWWNDIIAGALAILLSAWSILGLRRASGPSFTERKDRS